MDGAAERCDEALESLFCCLFKKLQSVSKCLHSLDTRLY